jgi:hypothetical protein
LVRWFNVGIILPLAVPGVWVTRRDSGTLGILCRCSGRVLCAGPRRLDTTH